MYKKILTVAVLTPLVVGGVALAQPSDDKKVTICHFTSSEVNPWNRIVVSENAIGGHFDNPGTPKAGHEEDILLEGDVDCPVDGPGDPGTPDGGGRGAGETPITPQVDAPVAGVNAGGGAVVASAVALTGSVASLGYGLSRLRKSGN